MRLLRALTLVLLMLHVVPVGAMRTDGPSAAFAGQDVSEHCGHAGAKGHQPRDPCGSPTAATCCEGASCASFGTAALVIDDASVLAPSPRTPAGPRTQALMRSSSPETPPPKA